MEIVEVLLLEVVELIVLVFNLEVVVIDIEVDVLFFGDGFGFDLIDVLEIVLVIFKCYGF